MDLKLTGLCRNARKVYLGLSITGRRRGYAVDLVPEDGAPQTPCKLIPLVEIGEVPPAPPADGVTEFVAVLPDLALPEARLSVVERDQAGAIVGSSPLAIDFHRAKWDSRLNYRVHPERCARIRDMDDRVGGLHTVITPRECIVDGDELILRGIVHLPNPDGGRVTVSCLDMTLSPAGTEPIYLGDARVPSAVMRGIEGREVQFSVRVPNRFQDLILTVTDEGCPENDSFYVLTREGLREMRDSWHALTLSAQVDEGYDGWFRARRVTPTQAHLQKELSAGAEGPTFSLVVPLYNTPVEFLEDMVASVEAQTYPRWELLLVNASPENAELAAAVREACAADARVRSVALDENRGISLNTCAGVAEATGDFVGFLDHDDTIEPDLLFEYAGAVREDEAIDLLYCDEDKLLPNGHYAEPFFKPDFAIDTLRDFNYVCHLLCIRRAL